LRAARTRPRVARAFGAAETLSVEFAMRNVEGSLLRDPETLFTFRRVDDHRQIGEQANLALTGSRVAFALPPQTGVPVVCDVDPQRYRFVRSPIFFATPGPPLTREFALFREPGAWTAAFTPWADLPAAFGAVKTLLGRSPGVVLRVDGQPERTLGRIAGDAYDGIGGRTDAGLAKTALLNLCYRLRAVRDPLSNEPWLSRVTEIVAIDRERMIAFVDPAMGEIVQHIKAHMSDFRGQYEPTPVGDHLGNVPAALRPRVTRMVSIKSAHDHANFQLTLSFLGTPDEVLLDADLDESGRTLSHLFDLLKHAFSGGTHPHDIHELLWHLDGRTDGFDLGYRLT
jgi:hypothetical protein